MEDKEFLEDLKRAKEDEYFHKRDRELLEAMRKKKAEREGGKPDESESGKQPPATGE